MNSGWQLHFPSSLNFLFMFGWLWVESYYFFLLITHVYYIKFCISLIYLQSLFDYNSLNGIYKTFLFKKIKLVIPIESDTIQHLRLNQKSIFQKSVLLKTWEKCELLHLQIQLYTQFIRTIPSFIPFKKDRYTGNILK